MKRPDMEAKVTAGDIVAVEMPKTLSKFPQFADLLVNPVWDDGTPKGKICLFIFLEGTIVKGMVKVEKQRLKAMVAARSLDELLVGWELLCKAGTVPWEQEQADDYPHEKRASRLLTQGMAPDNNISVLPLPLKRTTLAPERLGSLCLPMHVWLHYKAVGEVCRRVRLVEEEHRVRNLRIRRRIVPYADCREVAWVVGYDPERDPEHACGKCRQRPPKSIVRDVLPPTRFRPLLSSGA